jgi:glycosyltransferase involved in cell wall biosynthesis
MDAAVATWRASAIDLVHCDTIGLWQYADGFHGTPVVLAHHNVESDLIAQRCARESGGVRAAYLHREARKLRSLEATAGVQTAVNIVVSELDAARLRAIAPDARIDVVENGVDCEYWNTAEQTPSTNRIVFAGTLGWYPNRDAVEFILGQIWPALASRGPAYRLALVGRDPPSAARAAERADPRVEVPGFVPDVRPYLAGALACVCPIRVGGGTRLKILDALASGTPVVATEVAVEGLDLIVDKHYLPAETGEEFVAQIARLEQSPDLRRSLGAAGRRCVIERYDWSVIGNKLDTAYSHARRLPAPDREAL